MLKSKYETTKKKNKKIKKRKKLKIVECWKRTSYNYNNHYNNFTF